MSSTFTFDGNTYSKRPLTTEAQADLDEARRWLALLQTRGLSLSTRRLREDALARRTVSAIRNISIRNTAGPTAISRKLEDEIDSLLYSVVEYAVDHSADGVLEVLRNSRYTEAPAEAFVGHVKRFRAS